MFRKEFFEHVVAIARHVKPMSPEVVTGREAKGPNMSWSPSDMGWLS